jgi:putative ABC transport system permease protein
MLYKIHLFSRPVRLSLRNTFRRRGRLALTLGTLTLAGTLFIGVMNIRASLENEFADMWAHYYNWQVAMSLENNYSVRGIESRIMEIPGVVRAESQNSAYAQRQMDDGSQGTSFNITGVKPDSESVRPPLSSGRWLEPGDQNVLVLTSALAEDLPDVKAGDNVKLKVAGVNREWEIIGIAPQAFDKTAYSDFDNLARLRGTTGLTSEVYISTADKDGASQTLMAETIESHLKQSGIKVSGSLTQDTIASANSQQIDFLIYFLLIMAIMSAIIGALGLMGMMSLNVMERTREIGVMRSIGATSRAVGSIVITEGLIIGIISWLAAIPVSIPMSLAFNSMLGSVMFGAPLNFVFSPLGLAVWLAIVIGMAFIASLLPAYNAMRMSIRETLAYE